MAETGECWVKGAVIVGGGPSGLATEACLQEKGVPCVILERAECIASLWQKRTYDRLKLHLPKKFCELPLMPFPQQFPTYPTKDQFITYLDSYATKFGITPLFNQEVECASYDTACGMWRVCCVTVNEDECKKREYVCRWLIVVTGENAEPIIPDIQGMANFQGPVIHASNYKSGASFRQSKVLVVGCANSGMEVSLDLCNHNAKPFMVVRSSVHVLPREILGCFSIFGIALWLMKWLPIWLVDKMLLFVAWLFFRSTERYGIKRPSMGPLQLKSLAGKTPVLDVGAMARIRNAKIKILPALDCMTSNGARFVNGEKMEFDSVILATGYRSNVPSWLKDCTFFSEEGIPNTPFPNGWKGENGLYAVGFTRKGLLGASIDAVHIADDVTSLWKKLNKQMSFCKKLTKHLSFHLRSPSLSSRKSSIPTSSRSPSLSSTRSSIPTPSTPTARSSTPTSRFSRFRPHL